MQSPLKFASSGHVGHFARPSLDSVYYEGELFSTAAAPHPGVIKFFGVFVLPFLKFLIQENDTFTVCGPWYSLVRETALKLNFSLVGEYPRVKDRREVYLDILSFRPDIAIFPFLPNNKAMMEALEMEVALIGNAVGILEMDHIPSAKRFHRQNLLAMLKPFDFESKVLMFAALFAISLFAHRFSEKINFSLIDWQTFIWTLTTAVVSCPEIATKFAIWRIVGLTWLLGVLILQQLFGGDMFTAMTMPPELDVVHTWNDLSTKSMQRFSFTTAFRIPSMIICRRKPRIELE